jgi:hypothetical protein
MCGMDAGRGFSCHIGTISLATALLPYLLLLMRLGSVTHKSHGAPEGVAMQAGTVCTWLEVSLQHMGCTAGLVVARGLDIPQ